MDVVQPTIKNARQSLNSFYFILFHFTLQKLLLTHTCPVKNPPIVYTLHSNETISLESILRNGFIFLQSNNETNEQINNWWTTFIEQIFLDYCEKRQKVYSEMSPRIYFIICLKAGFRYKHPILFPSVLRL